MFVELILSACAIAVVFFLVGPTKAVLIAMPLLVWSAYRLGHSLGASAAAKSRKVEINSPRLPM